MDLPTADDLYTSATNATPAAPPAAPTPSEGVTELPNAGDLYDNTLKQADEQKIIPTVGRVVQAFGQNVAESYASHAAQKGELDDALTSPVKYMAKDTLDTFTQGSKQLAAMIASPFLSDQQNSDLVAAGDIPGTPVKDQLVAQAQKEGRDLTTDEMKQIGAEAGGSPLAPFVQTVFSPLAALNPLFEGAMKTAQDEGVSKGNLAIANTLLLAAGLARVPHAIIPEALESGVHLTEDKYMGLTEPTQEENKVAQVAAQQVEPPAPVPTIHELARQIAPDTFKEYDSLAAQRTQLGNMMRDLSEKNRQGIEESSPFTKQIEDAQQSMAGGSKRQKKIAQAKIDDLQEQHEEWVQQNLAPSEEMEQVRQKYNDVDFRMRDLAPDVSKAYRDAQQQAPKSAEVIHPDELEPTAPEEEPKASAPEPGKPVEEQKKFIINDYSKKLIAAGRPAEESHEVATLMAEHYQALSERGWTKGTPEEIYKRDGANIRKARERVKELTQKGNKLTQTEPEGTKEFKQWFGKSKVVDENAEPMVVYHGTNADISAFDMDAESHGAQLYGKGAYFSDNPRYSSQFASEPEKANVIPAYLSLKNPYIIDDAKSKADFLRLRTSLGAFNPKKLTAELKAMGYDGVIFKDNTNRRSAYVAFHPEQIKSIHNSGKFSSETADILHQKAKGYIRLATDDAKALITLFKSRADASTIIHETGHMWLDNMMRYAAADDAPESLRAEAAKVRKWLGVGHDVMLNETDEKGNLVYRDEHEKFARGFERYLMEGVAPSRALAGVFAKFKTWLTKIYKTFAALDTPLNDDMRDVFSKLLSSNPEKTIIADDSHAGKMMADIHEADARLATPQHAAATADNIETELDKTLQLYDPEIYDAIKEAESGKAPSIPTEDAGATAVESTEPEPATGQRDTVAASGGGSEADSGGEPAENAVGRSSAESTVTANGKFNPTSRFVDRAGNIRLDNLNAPEDVNQVLRDISDENSAFLQARRGVMSDGEVLTLAESLGMDPAMLNRRKIGDAYNAEQIVAARKLLIQSATAVRDAAAKAANGTDADLLSYAEMRSRHRMIQEQVAGITAEAGRALRAFRELKGSADTKALGEILAAGDKKIKTDDLLFQLRNEANLLQTLDNAAQVSKYVNDSKNMGLRDMVLEYYINALISGPITHLRYSVGNALNAVWAPLVETPVAAAIGALKGDDNRVYLGESGAMLHGMLKGSKDGWQAAITAFKTGRSPSLPGEKPSPMLLDKTNAIPGKIGKAINLPSKSVAAIHSFFKSIRYEQNIQALAYRAAMREGLEGDAFVNRVSDLTTSPTEAMMETATAHSLKELYMSPTEYHSAMGALTRFTNQSLVAKIILPFMKIGSQITRNAFIERTPLGFTSAKIRATIAAGGAERDFQLAKMATGTALVGTGVLLCSDGLMTGDGPTDPEKRRVWLLSHSPNSLKIGGVTIPYQGLGHLGMLLRFTANMYETAAGWDDSTGDKLAKSFMSLFEGVNKSVLDENFMRGLKDVLDAVYHPEEYGANYLKNFTTNWLPFSVGLGQVARTIDPSRRETQGILDAAWAKIPFASEGLFPQRDIFGQPIPNSGPIQSYKNDPVVQRMQALQMGVGKLEKKINGVQLTPQQYDDYARISGKLTKVMLGNLITGNFSTMPQGEQRKLIKTTIEHARETARNMVKFNPANQNIIQQIIDNKRAILR